MPLATSRVRLSTLVREELRALPRNRFALGGAAVVLAAIAFFAVLATEGPDDMVGFLAFFWIVGPLVVGVVVAARVAAPRRTRFVDSLYTTPLTPGTWLLAHAIVGLVLLALALGALLPFFVVHAAHLGVPADGLRFLLIGLLLGLAAVAWGLLAGVVVGEAGPGAAAALAAGIGFVSFVSFILRAVLLGAPAVTAAKAVMLQVLHATPVALAVDAAGVDLAGHVATQSILSALALGILVAGLAALAFRIAMRHQSPLGWERRSGVGALVALMLATLLMPIVVAAPAHETVPDDGSMLSIDGDHFVTVVPRGTEISDVALSLDYYWDEFEPLLVGEEREMDLLVLLRVPADAQIRDLRIEIGSDASLVATGRLAEATATPDGKARETRGWGEPDGTGPLRPVFRVPVTVRAVDTNALQRGYGSLHVTASFVANGDRVDSEATFPVFVSIANATAQLVAAGTPLPLLATSTLVRRTLRTR